MDKAGTHVTMAPSVSYSITVRLEVASHGRAVSEITRAVEAVGGVVTALDVTSGGNDRLRVDVTCAARGEDHGHAIVDALAAIDGVRVHKVSDRTFLLHLGGKIEMRSKVPPGGRLRKPALHHPLGLPPGRDFVGRGRGEGRSC